MQFLSNIKNSRTPDGKENAEKAFGIMKHINKLLLQNSDKFKLFKINKKIG